jgi:hypothetical protein
MMSNKEKILLDWCIAVSLSLGFTKFVPLITAMERLKGLQRRPMKNAYRQWVEKLQPYRSKHDELATWRNEISSALGMLAGDLVPEPKKIVQMINDLKLADSIIRQSNAATVAPYMPGTRYGLIKRSNITP